jgi:hypothetical protein
MQRFIEFDCHLLGNPSNRPAYAKTPRPPLDSDLFGAKAMPARFKNKSGLLGPDQQIHEPMI